MTDEQKAREAFEKWWNPMQLPEQAPDRLIRLYAEKAWQAAIECMQSLGEPVPETAGQSGGLPPSPANQQDEAWREELIEMACNAAWRRDYPNGGSLYKTYDGTPYYDKQLYRKEVTPIVDAFANAGKVIRTLERESVTQSTTITVLKQAAEALELLRWIHKVYADANLSFADNWFSDTQLFLDEADAITDELKRLGEV